MGRARARKREGKRRSSAVAGVYVETGANDQGNTITTTTATTVSLSLSLLSVYIREKRLINLTRNQRAFIVINSPDLYLNTAALFDSRGGVFNDFACGRGQVISPVIGNMESAV